MPTIKYRALDPNLVPRRTRMEIPGWAGAQEPRANGSCEQPWHCIPFTEAARAGIELCYPFETELRVSRRDGALHIEGDQPDGMDLPPFRDFGVQYYTYQAAIDLKVDPAFAIKVETHPRFYTDTTGTVPIAVPAIIRSWWPMIYFVVFKSPAEGQTHVFRPGDPMLLVSFLPADDKPDLVPMNEEEAAERELQSRRIYASRETLSADTQWMSSTDTVFDGTYRRLSGAARSTK